MFRGKRDEGRDVGVGGEAAWPQSFRDRELGVAGRIDRPAQPELGQKPVVTAAPNVLEARGGHLLIPGKFLLANLRSQSRIDLPGPTRRESRAAEERRRLVPFLEAGDLDRKKIEDGAVNAVVRRPLREPRPNLAPESGAPIG